MDIDASATAAAGLAARLAALRARQQLTALTYNQREDHEGPAAVNHNVPGAQQQQQQQDEEDEENDQHVLVLNRLRVLQQRQGVQQQQDLQQQQQQLQECDDVLQRITSLQHRQSDQQQQQMLEEEEDQQEECVPIGQLDTLQQLQPPLPEQQQQQVSSQAEQQHHQQQQQEEEDNGQAKQQQQRHDQSAAALLQRVHLLQQRQAKGQQQQQQQRPAIVLQGDQLQIPEDFIHCLRDMLATENFPMSVDHDNCEDQCEVECEVGCEVESEVGCEISGAAAAAAAGAEPDPGWHAVEGTTRQQAGPHACRYPQGCDQHQYRSEMVEVVQQQQQQQQHRDHQHHHQQQQVAPDQMVPGHARNLLVLAAQSITAGQYTEARIRAAAAAAAAAASISSSTAVASFCRECQKLSAIALLLDSVPQQQWFAALQLVSPETANTNPAAAAAAAPGSSSVTVQDVQRSYKRLAALVHPDKCRHSCAEAAFKALSTAYDQALRVWGSQGGLNPMFADMDDSVGFSNGFSHGFGSNNPGFSDNPSDDVSGGYAWWSEWERDVSAGRVDGAAAAAGGGSSSTAPTTADEEDELWRISMQELAAEVERRQAGALRPQCQADAARPALERQKRLRVARSVLSARMQQQRQASTAAGYDSDGVGFEGGGFMCDDNVGYQQTTGWKRQRV